MQTKASNVEVVGKHEATVFTTFVKANDAAEENQGTVPLQRMDMDVPTKMATIVKESLVLRLERMAPSVADNPVHNKGPSFAVCSSTNKGSCENIMDHYDLLYNVLAAVADYITSKPETLVVTDHYMVLPINIVDPGNALEMRCKLLGNEAIQTEAKDGERMPYAQHEVRYLSKAVYYVVLEHY